MLNINDKLIDLIEEIGPKAFALACVIAKYTNKKGTCYPKTVTLMKKSKLGRDSFRLAINQLIDRKIVAVHQERKGGRFVSNVYKINNGYLKKFNGKENASPSPDLPLTVQPTTEKPSTDSPSTANDDLSIEYTTSIEYNLSIEEERSIANASLSRSNNKKLNSFLNDTEKIKSYLSVKTKSHSARDSAASTNLLVKRLEKGMTMQQAEKVIDCKCGEWLEVPHMKKHLVIETLFGKKYESYLEQAREEWRQAKNGKAKKTKTNSNNNDRPEMPTAAQNEAAVKAWQR